MKIFISILYTILSILQYYTWTPSENQTLLEDFPIWFLALLTRHISAPCKGWHGIPMVSSWATEHDPQNTGSLTLIASNLLPLILKHPPETMVQWGVFTYIWDHPSLFSASCCAILASTVQFPWALWSWTRNLQAYSYEWSYPCNPIDFPIRFQSIRI